MSEGYGAGAGACVGAGAWGGSEAGMVRGQGVTVTCRFWLERAEMCLPHIVPCGKFHRIGGAPPETLPSEKYDAPEEVGGDRKSFDSPIRK